jgi:adenylate cyclase
VRGSTPDSPAGGDPGPSRITRRFGRRARTPAPTGLPAHLLDDHAVRLVRRIRWRLMVAMAVANTTGVALVLALVVTVLPGDPIHVTSHLVIANSIAAGVFLLVICPIGVLWGEAWLRSGRRWLHEGRAPTEREVVAVLRAPFRLFTVHASIWFLAAFVFSLLNALIDVDLLPRVAFTTAFAGLTTSAFAYLLAERLTRPLASAAMSISDLPKPRLPGILTRTLLGWILGTGVPLLGLTLVGLFALIDGKASPTQLAVTMMVVAGIGLVVGWWSTVLGARAIGDPVRSLYGAVNQLAGGDMDTRVEVYDGSVLGLLQAGFNDMAEGLQEREQLRDLYGRQVGEDVAQDSLERGTELGGEVCDVAVLFVDVVGSTHLASTRPPQEVVDLLNRFFTVVVEEVHRHGGWINKFQGDATLAVFGAPTPIDDPAGKALATGRAVAERLPVDVPELGAGIGVSYGQAVAGRIGNESRFEFTVIGDPVNEAARLTELAKLCDPMLLASMASIEAAEGDEHTRWQEVGRAELRGRATETRLAQPVGARVRDAIAPTTQTQPAPAAPGPVGGEGRPDADPSPWPTTRPAARAVESTPDADRPDEPATATSPAAGTSTGAGTRTGSARRASTVSRGGAGASPG